MTGGNCGTSNENTSDSLVSEEGDLSDTESDYHRGPKRLRKNQSKLKDPLSTGRKEAARKYKIDKDADCEWAYLEKAGGGKHPIKGCGLTSVGVEKQAHLHHGPDKNTLNNEPGNVHKIGHFCHNRWHAANDDDYDPTTLEGD
jgi:hypothetical protein